MNKLFFIGLVFLTGCVQLNYYTPPPTNNLSSVAFKNIPDKIANFRLFLGENCTEKRIIKNPILGNTTLSPRELRVFQMERNKEFTFEIDYHVSYSSSKIEYCKLMYSFTPTKKEYKISSDLKSDHCTINIEEKINGNWSELSAKSILKPRTFKVAITESSGWCEAI